MTLRRQAAMHVKLNNVYLERQHLSFNLAEMGQHQIDTLEQKLQESMGDNQRLQETNHTNAN